MRMRFILNLSFLNMQLVHMFRIPPPVESRSNFLLVLRMLYLLEKKGGIPHPIPLRERGRDLSPTQTNNESPSNQRSGYRRIPQ